ncbi:MAG: hypothetical protein J7576_06065, partial [Siphonobacter aquaeclarae]|nr:hypothetical protein [Siphonobacter aquaeclarae]
MPGVIPIRVQAVRIADSKCTGLENPFIAIRFEVRDDQNYSTNEKKNRYEEEKLETVSAVFYRLFFRATAFLCTAPFFRAAILTCLPRVWR